MNFSISTEIMMSHKKVEYISLFSIQSELF
uniref:Uncharacterized protein n=1 Tax=Octopus bimaculoides TaxID=37653 RepID=A0A0L8H9U8_OCTBM